ncbi:Cell wall hydrolase CwlJ, involved in spore germination [Devosia lucknowensis]|uniref:Cell wall hydrolase CwlJ, involved in spore germination n=1 Tax=Devosia lucknowensis TaxID=1096929 RepID=A0A1Y6GA35_9HYPH|nr:cell wall hydrolase [Devosia lucknowensis]SMQ85578.1 Cell wall hydrolase CwlJ, involved in spore germination [Devosia lucknowensis]
MVLFVTLSPARADTPVTLPAPVPAELTSLRLQPAIGPTDVALAPGQQKLTPALLANYVKRQQELRSVDVTTAGPQPELTTDVLLSYIGRGSFGGDNTALSAIASFTQPSAPALPSVTSDLLADYIQSGYQPTSKRVEYANGERECLAQAIYHEARGESATGQMAVANIIVNRARSDKFPSTLCGVIYQNADKGRYRCQFTFACDGRDDTPGERRAWLRSQDLARQVYAEFAQGQDIGVLPGSALYYHTTAVRPSWANTFSRVAVVDSHIFYSPN